MPTGMQLPVTTPVPATQPRRLLDIIPRLLPAGDTSLRWLEGVTWEPWACRALTVDQEADCDPNGYWPDTLVADQCQPARTQVPFRILDAYKMSLLDSVANEIGVRLQTRYNLQISAAFARELIGPSSGGGHSLSSSATPPNGAAFGAAAVTAWLGLQILEEEIAERLQGGVGYIHVPPGMLGRYVVEAGLHLNANGVWETPNGNIVISDAGYWNPPAPAGGGSASTAANDWVYASGPVLYEATAPALVGAGSETFLGSTPSAPAFNRNTVLQYIAGYGILVFDPCPVTAVLAAY